MKNNIIIKGAFAFGAAVMLSACSSDYLDLSPESNFPEGEVNASAENMQIAMNGVYLSMHTQYQSTGWNQYTGEAYVNTVCNDAMGQDYISGLATAMFYPTTLKGTDWSDATSNLTNIIPWDYSYGIIQQVNKILDAWETAAGTEEDKAWVKAQALTIRAHCYTKLLQFYAPRWEDSNNGDVYCLVNRTSAKIEYSPLMKMSEALDLIYSDLNTALECYDKAGNNAREMKWGVNKNIAQGIYARVALLKHDWKTAQEMAKAARKGFEIMDADTYLAGFFQDNDDFMWATGDTDSDIYYWSWGSHYAANGAYVDMWKLGGGAIDIDLYNQLDEKDIRRKCYLTPDKIAFLKEIRRSWVKGGVTAESFWDENLVDDSNYLNVMLGGSTDPKDGKSWGLTPTLTRYLYYYVNSIFTGDLNVIANDESPFYAYYTYSDQGTDSKALLVKANPNMYAVPGVTPFGSQLKFFSKAPYGTGMVPFMRAAEMCLAEAEAAYYNGKEDIARACLEEINSKRIEGYTCTKTGNDLLNEIRLTRRIELWGEGQNWSDFKRWNLPINRRAWEAGNPESGNWMSDIAGEVPTNLNFGWMHTLPESESQYNPAVDRNLLPQ